jgi:hypothetical protein
MEFNDRRNPRPRMTDNEKDVRHEKYGSDFEPSKKMVAKCGHEDALGYMSGTVCGKCARKNHKKAMGR